MNGHSQPVTGDWDSLPPELVAQIYMHLPLRERKLGETCRQMTSFAPCYIAPSISTATIWLCTNRTHDRLLSCLNTSFVPTQGGRYAKDGRGAWTQW